VRFDVLRFAAGGWLCAMLLAQWAFFYYIAAFYGGSVVSGELDTWNRLAVFGRTPYVAGDTLGNSTFAGHALGAGLLALTGALQLIPGLRARWPRFHRWNGRVFLSWALALSLSGFYLAWVRDGGPSRLDSLGTSLNGLLIVGFVVAAWTAIRRSDIAAHREWALRLYLVANAQWFLRVGLFAYLPLSRLAGAPPEATAAFVEFWKFGCFLVPLGLLQLYLHASRRGGALARGLVAAGLVTSTLAMVLGAVVFGIVSQKLIVGEPLAP
jgi:uncharacterized membrane protein